MRSIITHMLLFLACGFTVGQEPEPLRSETTLVKSAVAVGTPVQVDFSELVLEERGPALAFPALAQMAGVQGNMLLKLTLNTSGKVEKAEVLDGPSLLRPMAENLMKNWKFKPVVRGGVPVRVQCTLAIPSRNQQGVAQAQPPIKDVVVLVSALNPDSPVTINCGAIKQEVYRCLDGLGLKGIEAPGVDPSRTLQMKFDIEVVRASGDIFVFNLMGRCSLLSESNLTVNEPGKPQRVIFFQHVVGQKGVAGFESRLMSSVSKALRGLVEETTTIGEWMDELSQFWSATEVQIKKSANTLPTHVDFSQVKVKKQPHTPRYPMLAKTNRIQGTVVVMICIDTAGKPVYAKAESGPGGLLVTAISYALQWEFEPARINDIPVPSIFSLKMPFNLH